ncbi:MAG: heparinase II/III family protein, partial [Acidobacteriota bacterium]|nr:heparinase II/III family protein [Acidobacteriota bacterium]
ESSPVSGIAVARRVTTAASPLVLTLQHGETGSVSFFNGSGKLEEMETFREKGASLPQAEFRPRPGRDASGLWTAKVRSGAALTKLRFLVLGKIQPHPRVLLDGSRLRQLRSQASLVKLVAHEAVVLREGLAYNANAGKNIALLSPVSVFPGLPQYFQLMESYSRAIAFNALDFQLTGDRQSLEAARRALLAISEWPTWTPPWFTAHGLHTYYEVGVFTQRVGFGYDLIANQLAPADKSSIAGGLWRNSIEPTLEDYYFNDRLPEATSNHMAESVGGALAASAALYGDLPQWNGRLGAAIGELTTAFEHLLEGLFPGDGSEAEPAGYEDFAMEGMSYGAAGLQSLGIRPKGLDRMLDAFWWLRYAQFKPGFFLGTGDFDGELQALSGYAWPAEYANNPALRAFYESALTRTLSNSFRIEHTGRKLEEMPGLLDLVCCTSPLAPAPSPPPSRIFPLRGSAVMRSGWSQGSTAISVRAGPWFNHEHHDQGSLQAAAFGEKLIAEAGYSDYYKDPRYANYFSQAAGHNTVLIDGDPFSQEDYDGRSWPALNRYAAFGSHLFSDNVDYLSANLAPAYRDGAVLLNFRRQYLFLKPNVLIVRDQLKSAAPYRYTFLLHCPPGDATDLKGSDALIRGTRGYAALTAGENRRWTIVRAPIPVIDYGDLDRIAIKPRQILRLETSGASDAIFAVGMLFGNRSAPPHSLQAFETRTEKGFQNSGIMAAFRTGPGLLRLASPSHGVVAADGGALAVIDRDSVISIFAEGAHTVKQEQREIMSAEQTPVTVAIREDSAGEKVWVSSPSATGLRIYPLRKAKAAAIDHRSVSVPASGAVLFSRVPKGEHLIEILY